MCRHFFALSLPCMTTSAFIDSPLGWIEIQCTEEAICMVSFRNESPVSAEQAPLPEILQKCIEELNDFFNGKLRQFTVPVIQPGTDFQQRVWAELMKIPYGVTVSYLELSKRIGDVKAIRAVGTTNGKNQVAILVPCHRVIGSNGTLTGYAGGLWRKQWLLEHELKIKHGYSGIVFVD